MSYHFELLMLFCRKGKEKMNNNIIVMPQKNITQDNRSLSILNTLVKLREGKKNSKDFMYCANLSELDYNNMEKFYTAATVFSASFMYDGARKLIAEEEIRSLIGTYQFSKENYREFVQFYGDLLKYRNYSVTKDFQLFVDNVENEEEIISKRA